MTTPAQALRRQRYIDQRTRATPAWADRRAMAYKYRLARRFTRARGERYVVDHIVPLNSPLVCGLHCEANLAVVREAENITKSNHTWPDAPSEQLLLLPDTLWPIQFRLNFEGPSVCYERAGR